MEKWTLVKRTADSGAAGHGMDALLSALNARGIAYERTNHWLGELEAGLIFIGLGDEPALFRQLSAVPQAPESFCFAQNGEALLVCGADRRGLAYALYDLAERIRDCGENALKGWSGELHSPEQRNRGVDKFISNSGDESWWMSRDYWNRYFNMLVASRFNCFTLIVGYDTAYMSPPYPFFVDVPGFEGVRIADTLRVDRREYLNALCMIGELCHEYGMDFTFGMWQQIPWQSQQSLVVEGLDKSFLVEYCAAGLKELLTQCPQIDMIHFRVNNESGVGTQVSAEEYWLRQIDAVACVNDRVRSIRLELRAKGMTEGMVEHAKLRGLDVMVSTKYCCEHAGLPHHLTQMRGEEMARLWNLNASQRYSYAGLLRKPRLHRFIFRLWSNGSTDLFTWGDADYVRRFVDSLRLGGVEGYQVMTPLSFKGGHEFIKDAGWNLFDDPRYQPEGIEDERYWLFYRLFGRLGYCAAEEDGVLMRPMRETYGACAEALYRSVNSASRLLPFIVGFHFPAHPQLFNWPEMNTGGALFKENNHLGIFARLGITYQTALPCDEGMFYSIGQYTEACRDNRFDGRYTPYQCIQWLEGIHRNAAAALAEAEKAGLPDTAEARGVKLDIEMLCALAQFYVHKTYAALGLSRYEALGDASGLGEAAGQMRRAKEHWSTLSEKGTGTYHSNLLFGVGAICPRTGTWKDFLPEIDADIARLGELCGQAGPRAKSAVVRGADVSPAMWSDDVPAVHKAGTPLEIRLDTHGDERARSGMRMRYRRTNQLEGVFRSADMERTPEGWRAVIPAGELTPEWDMMVYFETAGSFGDGLRFPGLWHPRELQPYHIVRIV
jgi:hypothetical protein